MRRRTRRGSSRVAVVKDTDNLVIVVRTAAAIDQVRSFMILETIHAVTLILLNCKPVHLRCDLRRAIVD